MKGTSLAGGDGMVLAGRDLYVVRADSEQVAKLAMSDGYATGRLLSRTRDPSFQTPTTATIAGERLLIINSQFHGPGKPPWTVSSISLP